MKSVCIFVMPFSQGTYQRPETHHLTTKDSVEEEEEEDGAESFSEWSERVREKHMVGLVNKTTRTITFWSERMMTRKEKVKKGNIFKKMYDNYFRFYNPTAEFQQDGPTIGILGYSAQVVNNQR